MKSEPHCYWITPSLYQHRSGTYYRRTLAEFYSKWISCCVHRPPTRAWCNGKAGGEEWQFHCWLQHSVECAMPRWLTSGNFKVSAYNKIDLSSVSRNLSGVIDCQLMTFELVVGVFHLFLLTQGIPGSCRLIAFDVFLLKELILIWWAFRCGVWRIRWEIHNLISLIQTPSIRSYCKL